jgi:hypothetical protein
MSYDPQLMYYEDYYADRISAIEYIETEMDRYKQDAVKRFCIMVHPNFAEEIAATIAFGHANDLPEASKIVHHLFLDEKHIAALNNDKDQMEEIINKETLDACEYDREY